MTLEPVPRPVPLSDQAYDQLRSSILDGDFPTGQRMSVVSMSRQLQMSRSPVRSAVERLVTEGLLMMTPMGIELAQVGHADLIDGLQVRSRLEGLAAQLATERLSAADLDRLRENLGRFETAVQADDTVTARRLDLEFHSVIRDNCGNRLLIENLRQVQARVIVATYVTAWIAAHEAAIDEHAAILAALDVHDPIAAERAAIKHLERLIVRVSDHFAAVERGPRDPVATD